MALADAELNDADRDTLTVLSDGRATLGFVQTPLEEHGRYLSAVHQPAHHSVRRTRPPQQRSRFRRNRTGRRSTP